MCSIINYNSVGVENRNRETVFLTVQEIQTTTNIYIIVTIRINELSSTNTSDNKPQTFALPIELKMESL